jgi:hypothetical protein
VRLPLPGDDDPVPPSPSQSPLHAPRSAGAHVPG